MNHPKLTYDGLVCQTDNVKCWYQNGLLHREDGPAILWPNGSSEWRVNGKLHRLDGPAVLRSEDLFYNEWWVEGQQIDPVNFNSYVRNWIVGRILES